MTSKQNNLALAAGIIRASMPDLRCLIDLLENSGQQRLAAEIRRQPPKPTVRITGQPGAPTRRCG
jgi:hypothetical protein